MPHKHKRKADDVADYNLAPTQRATPLPVGKGGRVPNPAPKKRKISGGPKQSGNQYGADDTPKAFQRLMAFKARGKGLKGLDDGTRKPKSKKTQVNNKGGKTDEHAEEDAADAPNSEAQPVLKILPGEKMSDFAQRVNQALPMTGIQKNNKKVDGVSDHRVTRHEKHLKKLQKGWREEHARITDKESEALELAEEEQDELDAMWEDKTADLPVGGRQGKKSANKGAKRKLRVGEKDLKEEDPWEALRKKREAEQEKKGLKGLHDVVQEPPTFTKVPREIFKVKNGARVNVGNVPSSAGSLFKREQLEGERLTIIDTYRKLMAAKKEGKDN